MSKTCRNCEKIKEAGTEGFCFDCYSYAIHQLQKEFDEMTITAGGEAMRATSLWEKLSAVEKAVAEAMTIHEGHAEKGCSCLFRVQKALSPKK